MRIAICDDEPSDLHALQNALKQYAAHGNIEIVSFSSASDLYLSNNKQPFDIAIVDIEMKVPNGYEIAQKLIQEDPAPVIIFLTGSSQYAIQGYGIAFRYLTKPIVQSQLNSALDAAVREAKANRFVFTTDGISHIIQLRDIYYFEVFNHHTALHTKDHSFLFRGTLKEITAALPVGCFGSPHQSYLVNFLHIETVTAQELHLTNGSVIPVSRRKYSEFKDTLYAYLGR